MVMADKKDINKKNSKMGNHNPEKYIDVNPTMEQVSDTETENLEEAPLTISQRRQRGKTMRRYKSKIAMARKRSMKRKASSEKLKQRSQKKARDIIRQRLMRNKKYSEMTPAEKITLDKRMQKISKTAIQRIAKKQLPNVRRAEIERVAKLRSGGSKNESFQELYNDMIMEDLKELYGIQTIISIVEELEFNCDEAQPRKRRFHNLLNKENQVMIDKRFKLYKNKTISENDKSIFEEITDLQNSVESFVTENDTTVKPFVPVTTKDYSTKVSTSTKHKLGINVPIKHMVGDAIRAKDIDNDGDVDKFEKATPDEITATEKKDMTKVMRKKMTGEINHLKKGLAFEETSTAKYIRLVKESKMTNKDYVDTQISEAISSSTISPEIVKKMNKKERKSKVLMALKYMDNMVKSKGSKQSIGGYAFDIARSFDVGLSSKELEKLYKKLFMKESSSPSEREQGTDSLVKIYKKDTPNQNNEE